MTGGGQRDRNIQLIGENELICGCVVGKLRKCHLLLPSTIHACPRHGPWAKSQTTKTCRGAKRVPDALVRAGQLRETTPTEKHRSSNLGRGADNHTLTKNIVTKSEEVKTGPICQGRHDNGLKDLTVGLWNVKNWKKVALNRDEWAKLIKKVRTHQGLSS